MKYYLKDKEVEIEETDSNRDGSKYIIKAYYLDSLKDLDDNELDELSEIYDDCDELNGMWG